MKQFVEVFGITDENTLIEYNHTLKSLLKDGVRIVCINSVFHPTSTGGEILVTVVFES